MFARLCLVLLAAACLGIPATADELKELELKPKWKSGDIARYEMTRIQVREVDGKPVRKVVTRTPVEVEVIDTNEEGSFHRWTQGSTVFDDQKFDDDLSARALNSILKSIDIDLELDADGLFLGVRNWKELRGNSHKLQDAVLAQMAKSGAPKTTLDQLRKEMDKFFATKESIELAFTRHSALLFLPFGETYELEKAVTYETELPNVLGGDVPFPAKGEYTLKSVNKETGIAIIVFKRCPEPKEMTRVLRAWVDDVAKKAGKPAPRELPELELQDVIEYEFDLNTGWVKSLTHTRTAKQTAFTQIETMIFTRKSR